MMMIIMVATADADIRDCHAVMCELCPHATFEAFTVPVERQRRTQGYVPAMFVVGDTVRAVAGYRFMESLVWGRIVHVDDLVAHAMENGSGYGSELIGWRMERAREADCTQFHFDSGVQRFGAHRFYLHKGLDITSHYFAMKIA